MRLVYFDFNNNFGGAPQSMIDLARRLNDRHEVHIVDAYGKCAPYLRAISNAKIPLHVVLPNARYRYIGHRGLRRCAAMVRQTPELIRLRSRLASTIRELSPDVIWVMNAKSLTFVVACRALRQIPVVHAVRGWATPDQLGAWLRFLFRRRVAAVMAVSTAAAAQLRTAGVDPKRLHTISSTIDFQAIQRQSQEPLAAPVGGTEGCPKLLMLAARPEPAKGHATALRAMARLIQEGRSPVLWIPGEPPVGVGGGYPRELKRRCEELKISDCVHFLGWRADMPQLIRASDICLLPSHTEGLPRSVLEAMLLRRPVVATGVGGIPDAITDGVTGHLFEVDDDQALSRCIAKLTDDDVHRNAIVKAASAHLKAKFDPDEHTRRVEAVFASVVGSAT